MKTPRSKRPERRQPTPQDLCDGLLSFIAVKFYPGDAVSFAKDRPRLLSWVVLRFACWLDDRGVTIAPDRYRQIMMDKILMNAVRFGNTESIAYRPAWLAKVVETHLAHHGDEYYEEAKSIRNLVEQSILVAGRAQRQAPDPVRDLAQAAKLLQPQRRSKNQQVNRQLNLL